ncbi:isoprenylcysteine carboxyl methyltransferase family protein [Bacillus kexueae]|uniref:isoprenylcysteine carboxyl methyltransferase family protein n=1 Tax=Aeribacillus kexueae TaxID=2078952 RepID=UPI001FAF3B5F|nr:isoprenylcysteine carboxylmethyltransferase family protein [Bacillus kexueae]
MLFSVVFFILILQRLTELMIAKNNERFLKKEGAIEYGKEHYWIMVVMHIGFFVSLWVEGFIKNGALSPYWKVIVPILIITQVIRYWSIFSLGVFWNTKIIVLKSANVQKKGPYRFLRHPNYVVVTLEILLIPLLFQAYVTAILSSVLNYWMLTVRIRTEEGVLIDHTNYNDVFKQKRRFIPLKVQKKY